MRFSCLLQSSQEVRISSARGDKDVVNAAVDITQQFILWLHAAQFIDNLFCFIKTFTHQRTGF